MPASLLASQFETLEEPAPGEPVIVVDAGRPPDVEVQEIIDAIGRSGSGAAPHIAGMIDRDLARGGMSPSRWLAAISIRPETGGWVTDSLPWLSSVSIAGAAAD